MSCLTSRHKIKRVGLPPKSYRFYYPLAEDSRHIEYPLWVCSGLYWADHLSIETRVKDHHQHVSLTNNQKVGSSRAQHQQKTPHPTPNTKILFINYTEHVIMDVTRLSSVPVTWTRRMSWSSAGYGTPHSLPDSEQAFPRLLKAVIFRVTNCIMGLCRNTHIHDIYSLITFKTPLVPRQLASWTTHAKFQYPHIHILKLSLHFSTLHPPSQWMLLNNPDWLLSFNFPDWLMSLNPPESSTRTLPCA
jgi:hypothetical protein